MYGLLSILIAVSTIACTDYSLKQDINKDPELVVYPNEIDFGHIESNMETGLSGFAVINAGHRTLTITKPYLSNELKYSLEPGLEDEYEIEPGESIEFEVYFSPTTYENPITSIIFESNDDDEDYYELPVVGWGDAPLLSIEPVNVDYGQISIGCDNEERITIRNNGNLDLEILNIIQMVTHPPDILMEFGSLPALPWVVQPEQEIDFLVSYIPTDVNYDESIITVESNDAANPEVIVTQAGDGDVEHWFTETFTQSEIVTVDIIFVVDNSGSMSIFQNSLATQMANFTSVFITAGVDYRIAFITTDSAQFISWNGYSWVDNQHIDPSGWMINVISNIGINGSSMEKGIEYAYLSLLGDAAPGAGFWRDSATLSFIYISDEKDWSNGGYQSYFAYFDNVKPDINMLRQFAVIGDYPGGCNLVTPYGSRHAQEGIGYYHMTQRYSGDWYSICAPDWGMQIQSLATTIANRSAFNLSENDVMESSIQVTVNGQITSSWSYNSTNNSIIFDRGSIPTAGQTIEVNYAVWGCGE